MSPKNIAIEFMLLTAAFVLCFVYLKLLGLVRIDWTKASRNPPA